MTVEQTVPESDRQPRAYPPSYIDRFTAWVGRLPVPGWSIYLGIGLVVFLLGLVVLWGEGAWPVGQFYPIHVFVSVTMGYFPALIHYLDARASKALDTMRPILKADDRQVQELRYRLTTLPAWPTALASLAVFLLPLLVDEFGRLAGQPDVFEVLGFASVSYWLVYVFYRLLWWIFGTLAYHTLHQLAQINRIYTQHTRVNLFRMGPLYAFSGVSALTAVGIIIPPYIFAALVPGAPADPITVAYMLPITGLALLAFVWPLLGIHQILAEEKARILDENALHFEAAIQELHQRVDSGELEGLGTTNTALATLESERALLNRIPTWPWQPETVRMLFTALALPLGLWIAQYVLQRVLGP
jgi:hypothetical protein